MRESLRDIDRLNHIKERIGYVMSFLDGKTFEEMKVDVMCYHAITPLVHYSFGKHIRKTCLYFWNR